MGFYRSQDPPLTSRLPDIYVARSFRRCIEKNNERMSEILKQPFIPLEEEEPDLSNDYAVPSAPVIDFI
jgi:hypothetical protein